MLILMMVLWGGLWISSPSSMATTILIDPGHGGDDTGAKGVSSLEKDLILEKDLGLEIAKKIYEDLKKDYNVYLTRSIDRTVPLEQRAEMAEKVNADLFLSVHINSGPNKASEGFETYYLDNHDDVAVKKIEKVENINLKGSDLVANQILIDLLIQRTAPSSRMLGTFVHEDLRQSLKQKFRMHDRGLRPGLFYVLALSKRPSILLEVGFISNKKELSKLMDEGFQQTYAEAVGKGVRKYLQQKKRREPALLTDREVDKNFSHHIR